MCTCMSIKGQELGCFPSANLGIGNNWTGLAELYPTGQVWLNDGALYSCDQPNCALTFGTLFRRSAKLKVYCLFSTF
jgi:hypothetical protein